MSDPLILSFDTSGPHLGAVVFQGGVLSSDVIEMKKGQAEALIPFLEARLAAAQVSWADLDLIGVGTGPGNFTGIRIAVSAARGLSLGLKIPAIGVSMFDALCVGYDLPALCCVPAPQGQIYVQPRGFGESFDPVLCAPDALPSFPARAGTVHIAQAPLLPQMLHKSPVFPLTEAIARVTHARRDQGQGQGQGQGQAEVSPKPLYVKPPDAAPGRDIAPVIAG